MRYILVTALFAVAGFFACHTTDNGSGLKAGVAPAGASNPSAMSKPAAEALLTVLYGN